MTGRSTDRNDPRQVARARRRAFVDDILRNPVISTTIAYAEALGLELPRRVIRSRLAAAPEFPSLGLGSLQSAFDAWSIPGVAVRAEAIEDLPLPAIVVTEEGRLQRLKATVFSLLVGLSRDEVTVLHPTLGKLTEPLELFLRKWTGYAFLVERDPGAEPAFARESAAERAENEAYRRSIRILPNFLTANDCRSLIGYCERSGRFAASEVAGDARPGGERERLLDTRTSDSAFLPVRGDGLSEEIRQRAASHLAVSHGAIEALQCVRYRPGQEFMPHYDAGRDVLRTHTLLIYLNDDFEGGETSFPEIGLTVRPKRGSALLFRNLDDALEMIPQALHAGLPVCSGVKYACNVWVRGASG